MIGTKHSLMISIRISSVASTSARSEHLREGRQHFMRDTSSHGDRDRDIEFVRTGQHQGYAFCLFDVFVTQV